MTVTELLTSFANAEVINSLSLSDKLMAGLITTILGMGITFVALIVLQFIISWMDRLLNRKQTETTSATISPVITQAVDHTPENLVNDNELVAVITSVIAMKMKTSAHNIVIKNIIKLDDRSPAWNRAGIIEQMNSRF